MSTNVGEHEKLERVAEQGTCGGVARGAGREARGGLPGDLCAHKYGEMSAEPLTPLDTVPLILDIVNVLRRQVLSTCSLYHLLSTQPPTPSLHTTLHYIYIYSV